MHPAILLPAGLFLSSLVHAQTATLRPEALPPEDSALRAEAVRLLERANQVSTPAVWPPNEMTLHFHVPLPAPGDATEGWYVSSFGGPGLRRQEWHYGAYQPVQTRNGKRVSFASNNIPRPAILELLTSLAPIYLVRFDQQDIIRGISPGPNGSRCIQFETVFGDRQQSNEVCVETQHGWLLSIRVGNETTRNSNFFPFANAWLPGHVERWVGNTEIMEIEETVAERTDYPPDFFSVPETSTGFICQDFRAAYAENTPQPVQGPSSEAQDIRLQGTIGMDGRVSDLKPIDQTRPDLNEEAIKLVSTWTFAPATCGGKPAAWGTVFTVHFKGR